MSSLSVGDRYFIPARLWPEYAPMETTARGPGWLATVTNVQPAGPTRASRVTFACDGEPVEVDMFTASFVEHCFKIERFRIVVPRSNPIPAAAGGSGFEDRSSRLSVRHPHGTKNPDDSRRQPIESASALSPPKKLKKISLDECEFHIRRIDDVSVRLKQQAKALLTESFPKVENNLIDALINKTGLGRGNLSNFASNSTRIVSDPSAEELHGLHLALASRGDEVVGAAVVAHVRKDRRTPSFWGAVITLFAVRKQYTNNGIGSQLLRKIEDWAVSEAPSIDAGAGASGDAAAGEKAGHVLILSAQSAVEAPVPAGNWWLSRMRKRSLLKKSAGKLKDEPNVIVCQTQDELDKELGAPGLPRGLWLPWPMGVEKGGIIVLAIKVSAIHAAQEAERQAEREAERAVRTRPIFFEAMCGSRRYANAVAEHQWHTLSIDDNSKRIPLEHPRSFDDPAKENTLKTIKPSEVHPDLFKNVTEPLHIHIEGMLEDIQARDLPTMTAMHGSPNCASQSAMARDKHQRLEEHDYVALQQGASPESREWDFVVGHFNGIVKDQRSRELQKNASGEKITNSKFGFSFEQPSTPDDRVCGHAYIKNMFHPIKNYGSSAEMDKVDICQLGATVMKPTLIIHSQLPALAAELRTTEGGQKFKCPGKSRFHDHGSVRGHTATHTAFHPRLAAILAIGVVRSFL